METFKFVLVIIAITNGHYVFGYQNTAGEESVAATMEAVLQRTVKEITTKYDTAIEALQKDNLDLKATVSSLKAETDQYDHRLNDLTRTVAEQGKHILALETSNRQKAISLETLENRLEAIEHHSTCKCNEKNDDYDPSGEANTTSAQPNKDKVITRDSSTVHQGRIRRANVEHEVAFFAYISHNGLQSHLGINQDIVFDHAVTNIGNAYSTHQGTFTAPVAGTYVFSATLHAPMNSRANFVVDGSGVAIFFADHDDEATQVSQTIVVSLNKGADVSIQNMNSDKSFFGAKYTTFSGFLLYESYASPSVVG